MVWLFLCVCIIIKALLINNSRNIIYSLKVYTPISISSHSFVPRPLPLPKPSPHIYFLSIYICLLWSQLFFYIVFKTFEAPRFIFKCLVHLDYLLNSPSLFSYLLLHHKLLQA